MLRHCVCVSEWLNAAQRRNLMRIVPEGGFFFQSVGML